MEAAVREFVSAVDRYLHESDSTVSGSHRQQLQQLQMQLQLLVNRFPVLQPDPDTEDNYYEMDEVGGGSGSSAVVSAFRSDGGGGSGSGDAMANGPVSNEFYDDTAPADGLAEQETYDDVDTPRVQGDYDDVVGAQSYVPMFKLEAPKLPEYPSRLNGAARSAPPPILANIGPRPDIPAPPVPPSSSSVSAAVSASASVAGSMADLSAAPSVNSLPSAVGSDDSAGVEPQPAAQLRSVASRWGRLEMRHSSRLRPWRRLWAGLVDTRLLLYQKETDPTHRLSVNLAGYEVRPPPPAAELKEKQRPLCFELVKPGGKTHTMLGLTPKDARQWMAALERAAATAAAAADVAADVAGMETSRPPAARPPAPPPPPAEAASSLVVPSAPASPQQAEELLYNVPTEEEMIYDDVVLLTPPPHSDAEPTLAEEIYEMIDNPGAGSRDQPKPAWTLAGMVPGVVSSQSAPAAPFSGALPEPPPARDPIPRSPRLPARLPPVETPAVPVIPPPPTRPPPPPPVGEAAPPALPARPQPPLLQPPLPQPPLPPSSRPPPPSPPDGASGEPGITEQLHYETTEPIQQDFYNETKQVEPLGPRVDPFYNVLELESEYRQPPHPSPVPLLTPLNSDEPSDEGYGNSSAGSEAECRSVGDGHYKALPLLRPVPVPKKNGPRTEQTGAVTEMLSTTEARQKEARNKLSSSGISDGTLTDGTVTGETTPSKPAERAIASSKLASSVTDRAGVSTGASKTAGSSVRDVIARLNRQSVGDEGGEAAAPHPVTISDELARKQALIAAAVHRIGSPPPASPSSTTSTKPAPLKKPSVTAPKPTLSSRPKKSSGGGSDNADKRNGSVSETARTAGREQRSATSPGSAPPPLTPNKSAVYSAMRHSMGRQQDLSLKIHTPSEEEDVYAEIDELPGIKWKV